MIEAAILVIFPFCMVHAALSDAVSMTIANRLSLLLAGSFLVLAPLSGMDWTTIGWHLAAGALVLSVTFTIFAIGGMGGGDAKLLAATALWMGLPRLPGIAGVLVRRKKHVPPPLCRRKGRRTLWRRAGRGGAAGFPRNRAHDLGDGEPRSLGPRRSTSAAFESTFS
jgi:hypothetical protein